MPGWNYTDNPYPGNFPQNWPQGVPGNWAAVQNWNHAVPFIVPGMNGAPVDGPNRPPPPANNNQPFHQPQQRIGTVNQPRYHRSTRWFDAHNNNMNVHRRHGHHYRRNMRQGSYNNRAWPPGPVDAQRAEQNDGNGNNIPDNDNANNSGDEEEEDAQVVEQEPVICFICRELLQNSGEPGIHLCLGHQRRLTAAEQGGANPPAEAPPAVGEERSNVEMDVDHDSESKNATTSGEVPGGSTDETRAIVSIHELTLIQYKELEKLKERCELEKTTLADKRKEAEKKLTTATATEEKLQKWEKKLELTEKETKKKHDHEREELKRQWQELRDEQARMEELHETQKGRMRLDVGGRLFTTSVSTLTRDQNSMLGAMFSGRHTVQKEADGSVFIDRDGTYFRHVLNYLRDGNLTYETLPRNRLALKELRNEAAYYQLNGMVQLIENLL